jgi:hypothetical protein
MATLVLLDTAMLPGDERDAVLLEAVASLLAAAEPFLRPRLSALVTLVCSMHEVPCAGECAERLLEQLASYLQGRHVLTSAQVTMTGADQWASHTRVDVVRCVLLAYARRLRSGGDAR